MTEALCEPLAVEDFVVQSMPDVSPTKWHLAHVSWFFEEFVLSRAADGYESPFPQYRFLFNSYYNSVGPQYERPRRGMLTRPTVEQVFQYREYVDDAVAQLLDDGVFDEDACHVVELGIHHEQQHQELMLTDIKHVLSCNPLHPAYCDDSPNEDPHPDAARWTDYPGGLCQIGYAGDGFAYDNESPRHEVLVRPFAIADRLVTNDEYFEFIEDGGYERAEFWLSDGWITVQSEQWSAPLYWQRCNDRWHTFTLAGLQPLESTAPVCHVSFYEADAFSRWAGARLATEAEWELAAELLPRDGNFVEDGYFGPRPAHASADSVGPRQMFGDCWEWTSSPYVAYPGYRPAAGALGEYNGKFMCNQFVLRGGSCATSLTHIRPTYRNFFPPQTRWQFSGIRLAKDAS